MKWNRLWTRKPKETVIHLDSYDPINLLPFQVQVLGSNVPLRIEHTVTHAPYPQPVTMTITLYDRDGRQFVMPPINCRGATYYPMQVPDYGEDSKWVRMDVKMWYP